MSKEDERVMVVKADKLFQAGIWEGFREMDEKKFLDFVDKNREFLDRRNAEIDETFQQIIAQIILKVGDKIFLHRIPQTGSESRLHEMWPIFLGGHINDTDENIIKASEREFSEEVDYKGRILSRRFWGVVKLHDNPVNKVHIGMVWIFEGDSEDVGITGDDGILDGRFVKIKDLDNYLDKMTYWSRVVTPYLIKKFS